MAALTVNGRPVALGVEPEMPLLWALRDELGLVGTKFGCGAGLCGEGPASSGPDVGFCYVYGSFLRVSGRSGIDRQG